MEAVGCQGCRERDLRIAELEVRVAELEGKLARLLGRNSRNSSTPPSANPPGAPAPVTKEPTGRKPGAQPGHSAQTRIRLPAEQVTKTKNFIPAFCEQCQQPLSAERGPSAADPVWHQIVELPKV